MQENSSDNSTETALTNGNLRQDDASNDAISDGPKRITGNTEGSESTSNYPKQLGTSSRLHSASSTSLTTSSCYPLHTPSFKRIDLTDLNDALIEERKPAWKQWQESIKDSYHKVRKNAERSVEETAYNDIQLARREQRRSSSPFEELSTRSPSIRRPSYHTYCPETAIYPEQSLYAAPAVASSQGIESRYNKRVNEIEARLLKTSILPENMKTITVHDFKSGPSPAPGSATEALLDGINYSTFMPRPYYSRPNRDDPDYFDFDLQHSVDLYKRPEGKYVPKGPQMWEEKLLRESKSKGDAPLSTYMFTKGNEDWRTTGTSYLSAALRTPSFWEHRFTSIGREVRDSNPISFDSLARNKPVPNRFTEYHDPDYEDLSDYDD